LPNSFLFHSLNHRLQEFRNRSQGTTMQHIKRSALGEVSFLVPPIDMVMKFHDSVTTFTELFINLQKSITQLKSTRDLLLPRLISGELDVSDLDLVA